MQMPGMQTAARPSCGGCTGLRDGPEKLPQLPPGDRSSPLGERLLPTPCAVWPRTSGVSKKRGPVPTAGPRLVWLVGGAGMGCRASRQLFGVVDMFRNPLAVTAQRAVTEL